MSQSTRGQNNSHARYGLFALLAYQLLMPGVAAQFKYAGLISPSDKRHQVIELDGSENFVAPVLVAPMQVNITITSPGPAHDILVPKYAPTTSGTAGYNPAEDCDGNFMSYKFEPNNNCYNYGCDIATNTFAQPGRMSGYSITNSTLNGPGMQHFAEQDGLINVGTTMADIRAFAANRTASRGSPGHFVSLMISLASGNWTGDFHWARCDDPVNFASWSQKDGTDSVTNFDFAGYPITDPSKANWMANQGPLESDSTTDVIATYEFYTFMFVPHGKVNII